MVIGYLLNHNFLEAPKDHDILADFSASSQKLISLEVVESLTNRYLEALLVDEPSVGKNKLTSLPVILDPFPSCGAILWKLPTWEHVKWVTHAMAPVFSLNLESINSISNAVKIYCLWLKNPQSRPLGVNPENLEDFITTILFSFAELFEQRKGTDLKSPPNIKRHAELCQQILKTIIYDLIPNSPLFSQKASKAWEMIVKLLLGMTDNLLWSDKQNYLAEDLSETLLNSLFFVYLESGIYCNEIWKKLSSCFKLWCHRLKSVLAWGAVTVALNSQIASILYSNSDSEIHLITFGMHSHEYHAKLDSKYANYCWARFTNMLPKVTDLSGEIFLRALQSYEKIMNTWLSAGVTSTQIQIDSTIDRKLPDANTLFEIYGEAIFDASLIEKPSHEHGRAIAISIICRIISKWQYRESISDSNLSVACSCIRTALDGDGLAAATALYHMESVLVSGHIGLLSLVIPAFGAIHRFVIKNKATKSPLHGVQLETLRMCCYRLLSIIHCYFDENESPISFNLAADLSNLCNVPFKSPEAAQKLPPFSCFAPSLKSPPVFLKASLLDILLASLLIETSPPNIRFLLNSISTVLFSNYLEFPGLFPYLVKTFEELLLKPPASWSNSLIDTQITIVKILEQWSRVAKLNSTDSVRLCTSLINMTVALHSKLNLPLYFRLIISIYDTVFSWLSVSGSPFACLSAFISALVKFMNQEGPAKVTVNNSKSSSSIPVSPSVYGIKTHKSLAERVFTLEQGNDDPRPSSLSPTLLKGVDEIFIEYTDSILQKLIGLLLQEQINSNYPVEINSTLSDLDLLAGGQTVGYFTLSSSIIVGFTDKLMFVRNSIGKFTWSYEYKVTAASIDTLHDHESDSAIVLDQDPVDKLIPFYRPTVVTESADDCEFTEILLNESNWIKTLENNKTVAAKIRPILKEVDNHLKAEICPFIPLKTRINRVRPQLAEPLEAHEVISRLLLTHFGFLNSSTQVLVGALDTSNCGALISDLKRLDELSSREILTIPIYFTPGNAEVDGPVSKSFEHFVAGLGAFSESSTGPIYADTSLQVTFPVITNISTASNYNESVSVIWSEDSENLQTLPPSPSNFVHFLVSPILIGGRKGQFFRIRILLARALQAEYNSFQSLHNSFGPLLDGMVVKKSVLSQLIRETSILAHRFISHFIENSPNPIMKRQMMVKAVIFKNYQVNTYGSLINKLI